MEITDVERGLVIAATIADAHANVHRKDENYLSAVSASSVAAFIEQAFLDRVKARGGDLDEALIEFRIRNPNCPGHTAAKEQREGK